MKKLRFIRASWALLLAALVLGVSFLTPALASTHIARHTNAKAVTAGTSVGATVYLTLSMLQPMFQNSLSQQVPSDLNTAIDALVSKLPAQDQAWTREMAVTLIQPSATLQNLVTQQNGMAMYIRIALYPGDPKPIDTGLLINFSVLDSSTIQASAASLNSGPALASGPQSTFQFLSERLTASIPRRIVGHRPYRYTCKFRCRSARPLRSQRKRNRLWQTSRGITIQWPLC